MREIIHLQAGQCGNQIGSKVRVCVCLRELVFVAEKKLLLLLKTSDSMDSFIRKFKYILSCRGVSYIDLTFSECANMRQAGTE